MLFTYENYLRFLSLLEENEYVFASYHDWNEKQRCVILRQKH